MCVCCNLLFTISNKNHFKYLQNEIKNKQTIITFLCVKCGLVPPPPPPPTDDSQTIHISQGRDEPAHTHIVAAS